MIYDRLNIWSLNYFQTDKFIELQADWCRRNFLREADPSFLQQQHSLKGNDKLMN